MAVARSAGPADDSGRKDAQHNRERVQKKIREALREGIGEEDIISAGPDKKVRVPIKSARNWRFIFDRKRDEGIGQGDAKPGDVLGPPDGLPGPGAGTEPGEEAYELWLDMAEVEEYLFDQLQLPRLQPKRTASQEEEETVFNTIARKGPVLDKMRTLREHLRREALAGEDDLDWDKDDLRYLSYNEERRPKTQAVVFLLLDVSGSMGPEDKRIARLFFYWAVRFLRRNYHQVEIVFIAHTTEAREVTEEEFFGSIPSGGTMISSAYELALEKIRERYPAADWNHYVLHASDGDNYEMDNERVIKAVKQILVTASLVGYLEIKPHWATAWAEMYGRYTTLSDTFNNEAIDGFKAHAVKNDREIWPALKDFFAKDGVEEAVS